MHKNLLLHIIKFHLWLILIALYSCENERPINLETEEKNNKTLTFSGTESCISCHENKYKEWKGSHHDLAMQVADSATILGDFNNTVFKSRGITYSFFTKNDGFYVNTEGIEGKYQDYKIEYTFGVYPLQQYIIKFPDGKYQCILSAWDSKKNKWFDLQPNMTIHHTEWMNWTGGSMTWNNMCADCHSTNVKKNYNPLTYQYNTTYSIIDVSCEACHGPSSNHVAYYKSKGISKEGTKPPKLYMDNTTTSKELVQKCARCHSRRGQITGHFDYKGDFLDHYIPNLMISPTYELDGQIKDEDYVYGSFVQSKMYHKDVSCKDCHNVHSLKLKKTGNALCLDCHTPNYNSKSHHFHEQNTDASLCINCHMTGKTYMGNDFRRDHSFRIPRPDQTVKYGTPNACNGCHTEKTAEWAANIIEDKFGEKRPNHFSDKLLAGYHEDIEAFHDVFSNQNYPDIIRATALNQYANQPLTLKQINNIKNYIEDLSPLVRNEAVLALSKTNSTDLSNLLEPLLMDSLRLVRISAARYFNSVNNNSIIENEKYARANQEFLDALMVNADFPGGQHQIALYYQAKGNIEKAIDAYYRAIAIDNYYNMSRMNLALLEYNKGNIETTKKLYNKVIEQEPNYSYPYYMLGLLYNENNQQEESLKYLALACEKEPKIARAFYNYALKLQEQSLYKKSIEVADKGLTTFSNDEGLLYVKLVGLLKINKNQEALKIVNKLLEISPGNRNYQNIRKRLSK